MCAPAPPWRSEVGGRPQPEVGKILPVSDRSGKKVSIAVSVEHVRGWGRRICEGIAVFANARPDWGITIFENGLPSAAELRRHDGFLWSVADARVASALVATGRPVVDLVNDGLYPGTVSVGGDHVACGRLAASHFLMHRFRSFAFFGWRGLRFSDARQAAFADALAESNFGLEVYLSVGETMRGFLKRDVLNERFVLPPDAKAVARWAKRLPRRTGVFCANDLRAWQLSEICRASGIDVPDWLAILGADNDHVPCLFTSPALSSVATATIEVGRRAAEVLAAIIDGERSVDDGPVVVPPSGVEARASTAIYPVDIPWLADALAYIREDVSKSLSAVDVVRRVGLSHATVENAFRRVLGTTIQREIADARLDAAERLLAQTNLPVVEVSRRCGFSTPQYFSLCFSRRHGAAPGSFRAKPENRS